MIISADGVAITQRFFEVIDILSEARHLRGLNTYTKIYGLNRRNILHIKESPNNSVLKPEVLVPLVRDFGVSGTWLLTGEGSIFINGEDRPAPTKWKNKPRSTSSDED